MQKFILLFTFLLLSLATTVYANEDWWTFTGVHVQITKEGAKEKESAFLMTNLYFVPEKTLPFSQNSQMVTLGYNYLMTNLIKPLNQSGLTFSKLSPDLIEHQCREVVEQAKDAVFEKRRRNMDHIGGGVNVYSYDVNLAKPFSLASANIKLVKNDGKQPTLLADVLRKLK